MPKQEAPDRDLLEGHSRYRKLNDLNEGTFGVVMLALDTVTNDRVSLIDPTLACIAQCSGHWHQSSNCQAG